jgi:hypothetical protein
VLSLRAESSSAESGGATCLVCYYRTARGSGICCNDHAAVEQAADNGGSCACRLGQWHTLGVEGRIAVVVGEVEAAHLVRLYVAVISRASKTAESLREGVVKLWRRVMCLEWARQWLRSGRACLPGELELGRLGAIVRTARRNKAPRRFHVSRVLVAPR